MLPLQTTHPPSILLPFEDRHRSHNYTTDQRHLRGLPESGCVCLRPPRSSPRLQTEPPLFSVSLQTSEAPMVCDNYIQTSILPPTLPMPSRSHSRTFSTPRPKAEFSSRTEANPEDAGHRHPFPTPSLFLHQNRTTSPLSRLSMAAAVIRVDHSPSAAPASSGCRPLRMHSAKWSIAASQPLSTM